MTTQAKTPSLEEFLTITAGSRDVGLIIAKDGNELRNFAQSLEEQNFKQALKATDFSRLPKAYFMIDENSAKDAYDFVVQYPTGQVEIFNKEQMQLEAFSPDYANLNLVLLVAKDDLNKLQAKGFDLLSAVGPAFQS